MAERVKASVKESGKSSFAPQRGKAFFTPRGFAVQRKEVAMPAAKPERGDLFDAYLESEARAKAAESPTPEVEEVLQRRAIDRDAPMQLRDPGEAVGNDTGMPDRLKGGLEQLSGFDLSDVRVHYNSPKPAQVQAHAYAQGRDIHLAPRQERHLPHEGWHLVQQMAGRVKPTLQSHGVSINDDAGLEREADVMGAKALQTRRVDPVAAAPAAPPTTVASTAQGKAEEAAGRKRHTASKDVGNVAQRLLQDREGVVWTGSSGKEYWREYGDYIAGLLSEKDLAVPGNIIELLDGMLSVQLHEYSIRDLILNVKTQKTKKAPTEGEAQTDGKEHTIPSLLHFYWVGQDAFEGKIESLNRWASGAKNSGWRIWLWHDGSVSNVGDKSELDGDIVTMLVTPQVIHKKLREYYDFYLKDEDYSGAADIARYSIIERYGGVYADADTGPGAMDFTEPLAILRGEIPAQFEPMLRDSEEAKSSVGSDFEVALTEKMFDDAVKRLRKKKALGHLPKIKTLLSGISKRLGKLAKNGDLRNATAVSGKLAVTRAIHDEWELVRDCYYGEEGGKLRQKEVFDRFWREWEINLPLEWVTPESDD